MFFRARLPDAVRAEAEREVPVRFESSNVSRDDVSREIGRTVYMMSLLDWLRLGWLKIAYITLNS